MESARQWIEDAWEYCQNNAAPVIGGAVVLAVIIIVIIAVIIRKRRKHRRAVSSMETGASAQTMQETVSAVETDNAAELVRKLADMDEAAAKQLESAEIEIQNAKVTLIYSTGEKKAFTVAETASTEEETGDSTAAEEEAPQERISEAEAVRRPDEVRDAVPEENRKFGPGNMNTGRSGHVYTEEELFRQIKD